MHLVAIFPVAFSRTEARIMIGRLPTAQAWLSLAFSTVAALHTNAIEWRHDCAEQTQ